MHQAFTFVQKKSRSGNLVGKLLKEHSTEVGKVDRFYLYQTLIKQKNNNYINEEALIHYCRLHEPECELFGEEEQKVYLKISRILVKYFIDNEVRINILTSSRMKNETKNGHLKVLRRVEKRLSEIYREWHYIWSTLALFCNTQHTCPHLRAHFQLYSNHLFINLSPYIF